MEPSRKSGCWKLAVGGALLIVIVAGLLIFGLVRWFTGQDELVMDDRGRIRIEANDLPDFDPLQPGETITRNRYLVAMLDDTKTELARQTFRDHAHGAPTEWRMMLADVSESGVGLTAELFVELIIDYGITHRGSSKSSRLEVDAEFDPDQRDRLLGLRRGEPVTVAGTLSLEGDQPRILGAKIKPDDP